VHQWDRWFSELHKFVDTKLYDKNIEKKALAAP
jgi:hypothetical protein